MAIRFDADADGLVRTASLPSYDANYTFSAWIYLVAHVGNTNYKTVFDLNRNDLSDAWDDLSLYGAGASDTRLLIDAQTNGSNYAELAGSTNLGTGSWHHIALVRSATNSRIAYLDGVQEVNFTSTYSSRSAPTRMDVCNFMAAGGASPSIRIAGIKIWTRALTVAEVWAEAQAIRPLDTTSLHIFSPCFPGTTERLADYSGNGYSWTAAGTLTDEDPPPVSWGGRSLSHPIVSSATPQTYEDALTITLGKTAAVTSGNLVEDSLTLNAGRTASAAETLDAAGTLTLSAGKTVADAGGLVVDAALALGTFLESTSAEALTLADSVTLDRGLTAADSSAHTLVADITLAITESVSLDGTAEMGASVTLDRGIGLETNFAGSTFDESVTLAAGLTLDGGARADFADGITLAAGKSAAAETLGDLAVSLTLNKGNAVSGDSTGDFGADLALTLGLATAQSLTGAEYDASLTIDRGIAIQPAVSADLSDSIALSMTAGISHAEYATAESAISLSFSPAMTLAGGMDMDSALALSLGLTAGDSGGLLYSDTASAGSQLSISIVVEHTEVSELTEIHDLIGAHVVSLLQTYCADLLVGNPVASGYAATEIRQGLLQEDPVKNRITILINPNNPDDTSESPSWSDTLIQEGDGSDWGITSYEVGGGERWWRRFCIDVYVYLVKTKEDRSEARKIGLYVISNIQKVLLANQGLDITDSLGEHAFLMLVRKVVPIEAGGPPTSFIWKGKIYLAVATEKE